MHLRRLSIHALPGIEPGFTFEPANVGINLVVGPNAVGKSSLARALAYLLGSHPSDPPALSLEAELESDDARWRVSRNGSQIVWRRNGEIASRPALPGADRFGLFRLSVEQLLDADDDNDRELAERLWRELHGNFDLSRPRIEITPRFARHEASQLSWVAGERRRVEREYDELQRREAELPDLERRIGEAVEAGARREHLEHALELADAIDTRKEREAVLQGFPPGMERLRGDEIEQLEERGNAARALHEELRTRQRDLEAAETDLDRTGLAQASPPPEDVQGAEERLRRLGEQSVERSTVHAAWTEAGAALHDTAAQFNDGGEPPRLDADAFRRAEAIALPLVAAQSRRRELEDQLELAGEAPEASEIERRREGVEALRAWLAGNAAEPGGSRASGKPARVALWVAFAIAVFAAIAAVVEGALIAFAGALGALIAVGLTLFLQRARRPAARAPTEEARRRFADTGLATPPQWDEHAVRRHLREEVESRLNELTLQQKSAAGAERIAHQIRDSEETIENLEKQRTALAADIGFDPRAPVAEFQRFVHLCVEWDRARARHVRERARLELLDAEVAESARLVGKFLGCWRAADSAAPDDSDERPDPIRLRSAFDGLKRRLESAADARHRIRSCEAAIRSLKERVSENDAAVASLFVQAGVESRDRAALAGRLDRLALWKEAKDALQGAGTEESLVRDRLAEQPALAALAEGGERARLRAELETASREADEYTHLIQRQTEIRTRLDDAGKDRKLEQAAAEEDRARQDLEDKRDHALLAVATSTLLDDVERAFKVEHEPALLRRARKLFAEVTARAFDLEVRGGNTFVAHDVGQEAPRALSELSSGTRMQLLLALRIAWIETLEQGGEALPLFLDEALTTSDETRFAAMAQSLERLAGTGGGARNGSGHGVRGVEDEGWNGDRDSIEGGDGAGVRTAQRSGDESGVEIRADGGAGIGRRRQIFYLSARRHEAALWQQATGARPAVIDLAAVRFPPGEPPSEDYEVETPPSLPAPNGRSAEEFASVLGVPPRLDPHRPAGGVHLFHLLRDDLAQLHALMDTWHIASVGQLEALLASDVARVALPSGDLRSRLRKRCRVLRTWIELWRQGRGRPVDRGVLEQCPAVSATFIDRVAELASRMNGDGESLVRALRDGEVERFRLSKTDELEQWLAGEGYTDEQERLTGADRRRLTVQRAVPGTAADAADVNLVVSWLEASSADGGAGGDRGAASTVIARMKRAREGRPPVSAQEILSARDQGRRTSGDIND